MCSDGSKDCLIQGAKRPCVTTGAKEVEVRICGRNNAVLCHQAGSFVPLHSRCLHRPAHACIKFTTEEKAHNSSRDEESRLDRTLRMVTGRSG